MHSIGTTTWLSGFLLLWTVALNAQSKQDLWAVQAETSINLSGERWVVPDQYATLKLNTARLKTHLSTVPHEQSTSAEVSTSRLSIPWPDGKSKVFSIVRYDMMEPALAERFPDILTGYGVSEAKDGYVLHFDWTKQGFHGLITGPGGSVYIDPYCRGNTTDYVVYYKKDYSTSMSGFPCTVEENNLMETDTIIGNALDKSGDCIFRSYRLAIATSAQYANFHGAYNSGDAALVLSAVTTVINRVNQVYERDLTIRLILADNTDAAFFYTANDQPYQNNPNPMELANNQMTLDAIIGSANYDLGHVFCTGPGGLATRASVCKSNKARGATGLANPVGDPFNIDFVAHELGHQFGANHTQNNDCNRHLSTAMEVGSGSTIMGYAGVCHPNIQANSDDYFHGVSLGEIGAYVTLGIGNICDTPLPLDLSAPSVQAGLDHSIPAATPFVLDAMAATGSGSSDVLISWEQWDNAAGEIMPPASTNQTGPLFRSLPPSITSDRYFPQLSDLVANNTPVWEVLPTEDRELNFQVTARSINGAQGCTAEDRLHLNVEKDAGPFIVSSPNTAVTWTEGELRTISWEVANTNSPPVSCNNVDIRLSYDGGFTYPQLLAGNTPNTGTAMVPVPAGVSNEARIMVKATENVFLDISDENFSIQASTVPDYTLEPQVVSRSVCQFAGTTYVIHVGQLAGFSQPVNLSVVNGPTGANFNFSANPVNPGNPTTLSISNLEDLPVGDHNFEVQASSSSGDKTLSLHLQIIAAPEAILLTEPAHLIIDQMLQPTISWEPDPAADTYRLELSTSPTFDELLLAATTLNPAYIPPFELPAGTNIYWRVRAKNECTGFWSSVRRFRTIPCISFFNNIAVPMPNGVSEITSVINISETGTLHDLSILNLKGAHEWINDLTFSLIAPDQTEILLIDQICGGEENFHLNLDDEASVDVFACPPTDNQFYQPEGQLSNLDGKNINGPWTLKLIDHFSLSAPGELQNWELQVCASSFSGAALPVELLSFSAKADLERILLQWSTATEQNNRGFEIQRRSTEEPSFRIIGWVDGQGTTERLTEYPFEDEQVKPGVKYYYRLYQVDEDGQGVFSPVRSARLWKDQQTPIRVFPNPVSDQLFVEVWESLNEEVALMLTDAHGKVVLQQDLEGSKVTVDMSGFAAGVYCLHLLTRFDSWVVKVVR